ncbi:hypothetical protein THIOSC15_2450005 [uncultured Thiomicrorhabdus sp.]
MEAFLKIVLFQAKDKMLGWSHWELACLLHIKLDVSIKK